MRLLLSDLYYAVRWGTSPYWHHEYSGNRLLAVITTIYCYVRPSRTYSR